MQVISDVLHNPEVHVPSSEDECNNESLTQNKVLPESKHNALSDLLTLSVFFQAKAEDSLTCVSPARSAFFQMNWKK